MTKAYITKRAITCGVEEVTLENPTVDTLTGSNFLRYIDSDGHRDVIHKKHCFDNYADAVADCKLKIKARIVSLNDQIQSLESIRF